MRVLVYGGNMTMPFSEIRSENLFSLVESLQKQLEYEGVDERAADAVIARGVERLLSAVTRKASVAKNSL